MWFQAERFINEVFQACLAIEKENGKFVAEQVITKLDLPPPADDKEAYWQKKTTTDALNILERAKLISGSIEPEFTPGLCLFKEVRYGHLSSIGNFLKKLPPVGVCTWVFIYRSKQRIIGVLGVLSFVKLANNAYIGAELISGWLELIAAIIILCIFYMLIRKIID